MTEASNISALLADQMMDGETQWSMGPFGAIAEFARVSGEPVSFVRVATSVSATTPRGGVRIDLLPEMRLVAFETTTKESWNHRVALCLPEDRCTMNRRATL